MRHFTVTNSDMMQIKSGAKLQIVCMQLDDPVRFRYHWPINCRLLVNQREFRVYPRHADNKVTDGLRDDPADISRLVAPGKNTVDLCYHGDLCTYVFFVQLVVPVSKAEVMTFMSKPETLEAATMRMRRIVRGQTYDDGDDEVQTMTSMMSLKCPFSARRIENPARLLNIDTMECVFDVDAFLSMVHKTRKWACPHSLKQSSVHYLARDSWLEAVLKCLGQRPDVMEIEVSREGAWRLRGENKWRSVYNQTMLPPLPRVEETDRKLETRSEEESEEEEEELRKAAMDAKQACKKHYQESCRNKNMEVVDLVSSDEEGSTPSLFIQSIVPEAGMQKQMPFFRADRGVRNITVSHSLTKPLDIQQTINEGRIFQTQLRSGHVISSPPQFPLPMRPSFGTPVQLYPANNQVYCGESVVPVPAAIHPRDRKRVGEFADRRTPSQERKSRKTVGEGGRRIELEYECINLDDSD